MKKTIGKGIILGAAIAIAVGVIGGGISVIKPRVLNPWAANINDENGIETAVLNPWN